MDDCGCQFNVRYSKSSIELARDNISLGCRRSKVFIRGVLFCIFLVHRFRSVLPLLSCMVLPILFPIFRPLVLLVPSNTLHRTRSTTMKAQSLTLEL